MTNLVVTTLDRIFNTAFDFSFYKCAGSNENERSDKKLTNPVNACAVRRETEKLNKVNVENQGAETAVER